MQKPFKTLVLGKRDQPESEVGELDPTAFSEAALVGLGAGAVAGVIAATAPGATIVTVVGSAALGNLAGNLTWSLGSMVSEKIDKARKEQKVKEALKSYDFPSSTSKE